VNKRESSALLDEMRNQDSHGEVRKLANGDHVIVINGIYLWSKADWKQYKKGTLPALGVQEKVEVPEKQAGGTIQAVAV